METSIKLFSDSDDDVQIVEEVIVVDVVNKQIPKDQYDKIVVIGENVNEASETYIENKLKKFTLQDHDYTVTTSQAGGMNTSGQIEQEVVCGENNYNKTQKEILDSQDFSDNMKESGVDMAFDAFMDLEENADLATFMKSHMEGSEDVQELWTVNSQKEVVTNQWTSQILRDPNLYQVRSKQTEFMPPSFKQSTPTCRTNMRQLLWREQCMDRERRRGEQVTHQVDQSQSLQIPYSSQDVRVQDIPNEVYKIETRLENPTKYHVLESQRRQVAEYLSDGSALDTLDTLDTCLTDAGSTLGISPGQNKPSSTRSLAPAGRRVSVVSGPLSPVYSSAATSPSEYTPSEVCDDFLEELLTNDIANNGIVPCLTGNNRSANGKSLHSTSMLDFMVKDEALCDEDLQTVQKDRVKKDNHNIIERRRRYTINDRITELGTLLPKQNEQYYDIVRDVRQNKGSILKASVDYIRHLRRESEKKASLEEELKKLKQSNRRALLKLQEYEQRMASAGLQVEQSAWRPATANELENLKERSAKQSKDKKGSQHSCSNISMDDNSPVSIQNPMLTSVPFSPYSCKSYEEEDSMDTI
eukprot:GFUD01030417.1.p1 GENE.GFUD01030417.1~~GFUD01030417.1.p1  ORF type:complete len:584 (+),score=158.72 GFUD01030417.1:290-2041(+)